LKRFSRKRSTTSNPGGDREATIGLACAVSSSPVYYELRERYDSGRSVAASPGAAARKSRGQEAGDQGNDRRRLLAGTARRRLWSGYFRALLSRRLGALALEDGRAQVRECPRQSVQRLRQA